MSNQNGDQESRWRLVLDYLSLSLGVASTGLGLYIAISTIDINRSINDLSATNTRLDNALKSLDVEDRLSKSKARPEIVLYAYAARDFMAQLRKTTGRIVWPAEMQSDVNPWLEEWEKGNKLMTGTSTNGLYIRQVVSLKVSNFGDTPIRDIEPAWKGHRFDNSKGERGEFYYNLQEKNPFWTPGRTRVGDLMEKARVSEDLGYESAAMIPLAHVSGGNQYYGQVFIPLELSWFDERQKRRVTKQVNLSANEGLRSSLDASAIGTTRF